MHAPHIEIHFEITWSCGLECVHCSSANRHHPIRGVLSPLNISHFIHEMGTRTKTRVFLTGGEPTLCPELCTIAKYLEKEPSVTTIGLFTSGCLRKEVGVLKPIDYLMATKLRESGVSCCYVSLYSCDDKIHERITRVLGSFICTIKSLDNLSMAGIETRVNCAVMKLNKDQLIETALFCQEKGVKEIRFLRLAKHGRAADNWAEIGLSDMEQKTIIKNAVNTLQTSNSTIGFTVAGFPELFDCRPFNIGRKCQAGKRLFYVDFKGNIFPCACKKRQDNCTLGNILGQKRFACSEQSFASYRVRCLQDG